MNYFDLYVLVLKIVSENRVDYSDNVFKLIPSDKNVEFHEFEDVLENLIDDGLIKGKTTRTKFGNVYLINHVTTIGRQFLQETEKPDFKQKLIDALKQEGIPLTPTNAIRFVMNLIF